MKKRRGLKDEDRALWQRVTRSVAPLNPEPPPARTSSLSLPAVEAARETPLPAPETAPEPNPAPPRPAPSGRSAPTPGTIDRKLRRKLSRGREKIEARIDLHGMTQEEAHRALIRFVEASLALRRKVVLVITGKGRGGDGVLRRAVPRWLETREMRRVVVGFAPASAQHGGAGALYVRLRAVEKAKRL